MNESSRFWDRIAERYSRTPVADEAVYQEKLSITRGYFRPGMELMEIGCGTGSTAITHAPHVKHIRAVDISEKMLGIAREKAQAAGVDNVTWEQSPIGGLEMGESRYDMILALSILHLLDDWKMVIRRIHTALKPGGIFVSSTGCLNDTFKYRLLKPVLPIGRAFGLLPLVRFFSRDDLRRSITDAGFEIKHDWLPGSGKAAFIVARKPAGA